MYLKVHVTYEFYVVSTPCHVWFPDDHPIWFPKSLWQWCLIKVSILLVWMTCSSPLPIRGRDSLIVCGWDCYPWGQKTTSKRCPIWRILPAAHEKRDKILRVKVKLLPMGPRDYIPEMTISCQLRMRGSPDKSIW